MQESRKKLSRVKETRVTESKQKKVKKMRRRKEKEKKNEEEEENEKYKQTKKWGRRRKQRRRRRKWGGRRKTRRTKKTALHRISLVRFMSPNGTGVQSILFDEANSRYCQDNDDDETEDLTPCSVYTVQWSNLFPVYISPDMCQDQLDHLQPHTTVMPRQDPLSTPMPRIVSRYTRSDQIYGASRISRFILHTQSAY